MSSQNTGSSKYARYQVLETTLQDSIKKFTYGSITLDEKVAHTTTTTQQQLQQIGASLSGSAQLSGITNTTQGTTQDLGSSSSQSGTPPISGISLSPAQIAELQQLTSSITNPANIATRKQTVDVDPNQLKTQLAQFFYTLDFLPKDVYDGLMNAFKQNGIDLNVVMQYIQNPDSVKQDPYKYAQVLTVAGVFNDWKQKGFLKQTPDQSSLYSASSDLSKLGITWPQEQKSRWESINQQIQKGQIPQYEPDSSLKVQQVISKADLINDIYNAVNGSLGKGVSGLATKLGADEATAKRIGDYASAGVTGAITSLLSVIPGLNVYMLSSYLVDQTTQIASVLNEPYEKQQFLDLLKTKEFWEDTAVEAALFASSGAGVSKALSPKLTDAVVKSVTKFNPDLGAKLSSRLTVAQGTPEYTEQKASYYIDHDKGLVYYRIQGSGQIIPVSTEKLGYAKSLLEDPETGTKIANIIGKFGDQKQASDFLNMINDLSKGLGTEKAKALIEQLNKMKPEDIKGIMTAGTYSPEKSTQVVDLGGKIAILAKDKPNVTLLKVNDIPKNEFGLYSLAEDTGIGTQTMESVLKKALADKQTGILYRQKLRDGDLIFSSDGKNLKIVFGQEAINVPLDSITLDNWQKAQGIMSGLKSNLDATTYESIKNLLKTQYSLTTPITPTASNVINAQGLFRAETQSLYDLLNKKFGFSAPTDVQKSATASITTKIGGKPAQITVNKQVLGDEKTKLLISELTTRQFDKSLLGKYGFTEDTVGVIKIQKSIDYLNKAKELSKTKELDSGTVKNAIHLAGQSGDMDAVQELALLQKAIEKIEKGDLKPVVMENSGDGITIAVGGAGAQSLNQAQQQMQKAVEKGDAQAIEQAMKEAGLSEQEISKLIVEVPKATEATITLEKVIPKLEYDTEEATSKEVVADTVVKIPKPIEATTEKEVIVQIPEIETDYRFEVATVPDTVVKIPKIIESIEEQEIVVPVPQIEQDYRFGVEVAPDTVVKIPKIIPQQLELQKVLSSTEEDVAERYIVETVPGSVVTVPIQIQLPLYQFGTVDVIDTVPVPPEPNPPPTPVTTPPLVPPIPLPSGGSFGPALSGAPAPRGKSEKEKLVI